MVEGSVVNSNMDDSSNFSGNLFLSWSIILMWEMLALGWFLEKLYVNCNGDLAIVFLYCISKHLLDSPL